MIIFLLNKTYPLCPFWNTIGPFLVNKNEFPLCKDVFTKFSLNWLSGSVEGRVFLLNHQSIVPYLLSSPVLKGCDPSFERSWILYPMMLVQRLVTIFSGQWLWRKNFLNFNTVLLFHYYLLFKKGLILLFDGRETHNPMGLVLLKLAQWFGLGILSHFGNVSLHFCYYLLFEKRMTLLLKENESLYPL